jgi:hypothetical protein
LLCNEVARSLRQEKFVKIIGLGWATAPADTVQPARDPVVGIVLNHGTFAK